jgi:hypothetical protein
MAARFQNDKDLFDAFCYSHPARDLAILAILAAHNPLGVIFSDEQNPLFEYLVYMEEILNALNDTNPDEGVETLFYTRLNSILGGTASTSSVISIGTLVLGVWKIPV